jgi:DNA polymerase III epsilon subunit-like protein
MFAPTQLAIIDLETTGLDKNRDRILEFGLVLVSLPGLGLLATSEGIVDPSKHPFDEIKFTDADWGAQSTRGALAVNGLSREYCTQRGQAPDVVIHNIMDRIDWGTTVLAGWGVDFDEAILRHEYRLLGAPVPWNYRTFDVRSVCNVPSLLLGKPTVYGGLEAFLAGVRMSKFADLLEQPDLDGYWLRQQEHYALGDALNTARALRIIQYVLIGGLACTHSTSFSWG